MRAHILPSGHVALSPWKVAAYAGVVILLVATALSFGAVLYQIEAGGHAHGSLGPHGSLTGWEAVLPIVADAFGFLAIVVLAVQLMVGYHLFRVPGARFRPLHVALAWGVVVLMGAHTALAVFHSLQSPIEVLPIWLDLIGLVIVALLALELLSGYRRTGPRRGGFRRIHVVVALAAIAVIAAHGLIGVYHTFTG